MIKTRAGLQQQLPHSEMPHSERGKFRYLLISVGCLAMILALVLTVFDYQRVGTVRSIGSDSWKLAATETKIYFLIHIIIVTAIIFAGLGVCLRGLATKYYYDTPYPFDSYSHGNHYSVRYTTLSPSSICSLSAMLHRCTTRPKYSYIANTVLAFGVLWYMPRFKRLAQLSRVNAGCINLSSFTTASKQ